MNKLLSPYSPFRFAVLLCMLAALGGCIFTGNPRVRTPGTIIDDQLLEGVVVREIRKSSSDYKGSHIVAVSHNGLVLLAGQVPTEELRVQAGAVAESIDRVRRVHNELSVGGPTSYPARTNDTWLTTKVKSKLIANKNTNGQQIKVITENGVVYLMGLITRSEADAAVDVSRNVYGVQKIVKVFEYLDDSS